MIKSSENRLCPNQRHADHNIQQLRSQYPTQETLQHIQTLNKEIEYDIEHEKLKWI